MGIPEQSPIVIQPVAYVGTSAACMPNCDPQLSIATLQGSVDHLHESASPDANTQPVLMYTLNPKCVTMGELYGEYNLLTNEWKDGLASTLIRSAVSDTTLVRKWVVFDGPVDALWIENMNTVSLSTMLRCIYCGDMEACYTSQTVTHVCI